MKSPFGILTLNVANPSRARAERQLEWLGERPEQVLVLTETSGQDGSLLLAERLGSAGWEVSFSVPPHGERGVMLASRVALDDPVPLAMSYLPDRVQRVSIGSVDVIGVYAPSRDASAEKIARKRRFLAELLTLIGEQAQAERIVIGDLNIVEPGQHLVGGVFSDWEYALYRELPDQGWADAYRALHPDRVEYSWVDMDGGGFRFDHCFVSPDLADRLTRCGYVHETRETGLSDHSAMFLELEGLDAQPLDVMRTLEGGPPSLF